MSGPERRALLAQQLSNAFVDLIRDELTVEELNELRERNAAYSGTLMCASHDYIGATDRMALAFRSVVGRAHDDSNAADIELWNAAWLLAKESQFSRPMHLEKNASGDLSYSYFIRGTAIEAPNTSECGRFPADPAQEYALTPREVSELIEANARLVRESKAKWLSIRERYPKMDTTHTGGGCMAWTLECEGRSYILITDADGSALPGETATEVAAGLYAANGDTWWDAKTVSLDALPSWIDSAISTAADPKSVEDYFIVKLGEAPPDESLKELMLDSVCGADCRKVMDAASALIEHIRAAMGPDGRILPDRQTIVRTPERIVVAIANQVISVYWRG